MIVLLFTVVPRTDVLEADHEEMSRRMHDLAEATPGFVDAEYYQRPAGGTFGVLRFEDEAALAAWRDHPDHAEAHRQRASRTSTPRTASRSANAFEKRRSPGQRTPRQLP